MEEVIRAGMLANAHDFIMTFPDGYNTIVGERGIRYDCVSMWASCLSSLSVYSCQWWTCSALLGNMRHSVHTVFDALISCGATTG
jgi:hypothetical protein